MRSASLVTMVFAVLLGLLAVVVVNKKINRASNDVKQVEVVVAKKDIARGVNLNTDMIELRKVAETLVKEGAFTKVEDATDRLMMVPVSRNDVILENTLGPKGASGLAVQIKEGMRAFTIETPKISSGVAGMIHPGNHVDVILTVSEMSQSSDADQTGGGSSTVLLQNVEVLAVDKRTDLPGESDVKAKTTKDLKDTKSVTLSVTPDQAALLTLGQTKGILHLSLRHPNDDGFAQTRPITMREIQFMQQGPVNVSDRIRSSLLSLFKVDKTQANANSDKEKNTEPETESYNKNETVNEAPKASAKLEVRAQGDEPRRTKTIRVLRGQQENAVIYRPSN